MEQLHVTFKSHCAAAKAALTSELLLDVFEVGCIAEVGSNRVVLMPYCGKVRCVCSDRVRSFVCYSCPSVSPTILK